MLVIDRRLKIPLYVVRVSLENKPDIRLERLCYPVHPDHYPYRSSRPLNNKVLVGDVIFHKSNGTIDLLFHGGICSLKSTGRLNRSFKFESSMGPLTWEHNGRIGKGLQLLDAEKRRVARFIDAELIPGNGLKVQIIAGESLPRVWLEEILMSAVAVLEWKRRVGRVGGLSMIDAKRMTRKLVSAVLGFPKAAGQFLKGAAARGGTSKPVIGYGPRRVPGDALDDGEELMDWDVEGGNE